MEVEEEEEEGEERSKEAEEELGKEEYDRPVLEAVDLLLSKLATRSSGVGCWYWPLGSTIVWSDENYKVMDDQGTERDSLTWRCVRVRACV